MAAAPGASQCEGYSQGDGLGELESALAFYTCAKKLLILAAGAAFAERAHITEFGVREFRVGDERRSFVCVGFLSRQTDFLQATPDRPQYNLHPVIMS
jgi:hypothetical protein